MLRLKFFRNVLSIISTHGWEGLLALFAFLGFSLPTDFHVDLIEVLFESVFAGELHNFLEKRNYYWYGGNAKVINSWKKIFPQQKHSINQPTFPLRHVATIANDNRSTGLVLFLLLFCFLLITGMNCLAMLRKRSQTVSYKLRFIDFLHNILMFQIKFWVQAKRG